MRKDIRYSSEHQRTRSEKRWGDQLKRFWSKVDKRGRNECWPWLGHKAHGGYGELYFDGTQQRAHRVSWQLQKGEIPAGLCVLHTCDNPPCCNPYHLFLGTRADNTKDMIKKGRKRENPRRGVENGCSKLQDYEIEEIRYSHKDGETQTSLARRFGVSQATIWKIVSGKGWRHIIDPIL